MTGKRKRMTARDRLYRELRVCEEPVELGELCELLGFSQAHAGRLIRELETLGRAEKVGTVDIGRGNPANLWRAIEPAR